MTGVGSIAGSAVGGFTARPATKLPSVFNPDGTYSFNDVRHNFIGFWGKFPYALPNFIVAAFTLLSVILSIIFISENQKKPESESDVRVQLFCFGYN